MNFKKKTYLSSYINRRSFLRKLISSVTLVAVFGVQLFSVMAYAGVLGTPLTSDKQPVAEGTTLITNVFNDSGVGRQTEHYFEYKPNDGALPVLTNGWSAYGKRNISKANDILIQKGFDPAIGINADFFSFQTGVPMSHTIIDGKVYTADTTEGPAVGFYDDGTAHIGTLSVSINLTTSSGESFLIDCLNKYRQPYAVYLYDNNYGEETYSPDAGRDIVLTNVSGDFSISGKVTATVESISDNNGSVSIPEGKLLLGVSETAAEEIKERLNCLEEGEKVTISITLNSDEWKDIKYAVGCTGGTLITDGELDYTDESAAPRTAIGIKEDGTIIFYTIDGRQQGYSFGVRKETLAKRLLELGCVDAVNLDGGGSTSLGYAEPGTRDFIIANSPSDGALRSCANFFFILNHIQPDGVPKTLKLDSHGAALLSGSTVNISAVSAYDSSYRFADIPENITYYIEDDADTPDKNGRTSYINDDGSITVYGNGDIYVGGRSGDAYGSSRITSVATPDDIDIYNADSGEKLDEIIIDPDTSIQLDAVSTWYGETLVSDRSCYTWTVIGDSASIGSIDKEGLYTSSSTSGAKGKLIINAGLCTKEIPVLVAGEEYFESLKDYPVITGKVKRGELVANVNNVFTKNNIKVTLDGKAYDFDFDSATGDITVAFPDSKYHKIGIFATTDTNLSSMAFLETSNISAIGNKFPDTESHWAKSYITYISDCGIVNGSLEGDTILFKPNNHMTRTELAIMLCNYLKINAADYADVELPFIDKDEIPWWAENHIKAIYKNGIMQGQLGQYGVSFSPNANVNRMEFAIALNRLLPKGLKADAITAVDKADIPFWAEESMRVIVTQGIMTGYPDGTLLPLQSVTRAEAVKMIFNILGAGK